MKIALAQLQCVSDMDANLEQSLLAMSSASASGAELICFPEIQLSPFFPQYPRRDVTQYAVSLEHTAITRMQKQCRALSMVAVPNVYLQQESGVFDASPVINSDGQILGVSSMVHIVQADCFYEQDYYTPAKDGFHVYHTSAGCIGVVICFDRHFPESIRSCVLQGAQLIVIPTANTRAEDSQMFEWEMRVAAMQNGVFIAMCNRVGNEGNMDFCGESLLVDPNGDVIVKGDARPQVLCADIDLNAVSEAQKLRPYLALRRPEFYC